MAGSPIVRSQPAYFEDYNEDADTTVPGTRQTANVAAKRSKPEIPKLKIAGQGRDEASDSGYSSQTPATVGSGSSISHSFNTSASQLKEHNLRPAEKAMSPGPEKVKAKSPKKTSFFPTMSRSKKCENLRGICDCKQHAAKMRLSGQPVEAKPAKPVLSHQHASSQKPQPPQPRPPLQSATKTPATARLQEIPILQPAQARPRLQTSQSQRAPRPASFHAATTYAQPIYIQRPTQPIYSNIPPYQSTSYPAAFLPTPGPNVPQQSVLYPSPQNYNPPPQPHIAQWTEPYVSRPRRASLYSTSPVIEYPPPPQHYYPSIPTYPPPQPLSYRPPPQWATNPSPVSPPDEGYYIGSRDEDYYRMPPPPVPQPNRPPMQKAATVATAPPTLHYPRTDYRGVDDASHSRSPRKQSLDESRPPSRPIMVKRPTAPPTLSVANGKHNAIAAVPTDTYAAPRRRTRPSSFYNHEVPRELEEAEVRASEAYQAAQAENDGVLRAEGPRVEDVNQVLRRRAKTHASGGSEAGSRTSRRSGSSEGKKAKSSSRIGTDRNHRESDARSRKGDDADEGLTMKFNANQTVKLDFKGDSGGGRTIELRQSRDGEGEMELCIGGKGRKEKNARYSIVASGKGSKPNRESLYDREQHGESRIGREEKQKREERHRPELRETNERKYVDDERSRKLRPTSRTRRSSQSIMSGMRRLVIEDGRPF